MLERHNDFGDVDPHFVFCESFPLVEMSKKFASTNVIWKKKKKKMG
jgi:hypothetical protein